LDAFTELCGGAYLTVISGKLISSIPSIMLGAIPLTLIHCGGHIIQAVGDYDADRKTGVHTFVVRYGRKKGAIEDLTAQFTAYDTSARILSARRLYRNP